MAQDLAVVSTYSISPAKVSKARTQNRRCAIPCDATAGGKAPAKTLGNVKRCCPAHVSSLSGDNYAKWVARKGLNAVELANSVLHNTWNNTTLRADAVFGGHAERAEGTWQIAFDVMDVVPLCIGICFSVSPRYVSDDGVFLREWSGGWFPDLRWCGQSININTRAGH